MAKKRKLFACTACGEEYSRWNGRCLRCNEWNTIVEIEGQDKKRTQIQPVSPVTLSSVLPEETQRILTPYNEFNGVCGSGIVPGSVILIGGEPGIGKSTLALQIAQSLSALYVSGEESLGQLKSRADRLGLEQHNIPVVTNTEVEAIITLNKEKKYKAIIIDSIQTIEVQDFPGAIGSVGQIRESAGRLVDYAKTTGTVIILIGHITKEGAIAGPKLLEHMVDTVLYFEGDFTQEYRILRSFKNRFGSINEIGIFTMTPQGLMEVENRNQVFLNPTQTPAPGNGISAALEGSRIILFEVQALVTSSSFSNPRRMADGLDLNRLVLICAVLEKHGGQFLGTMDVFINVSGGFHIHETCGDLAIAMAIVSSVKERAIPQKLGMIGELSLSGDIRPVSHCERRLNELGNTGYTRIIVPKGNRDDAERSKFSSNVILVDSIAQAIEEVFS